MKLKKHEIWWQKVNKDPEFFKNFANALDTKTHPEFWQYIENSGYKTILDCAGGTCIDAEYFLKDDNIKYSVIDISKVLVEKGKELGVDIRQGSIEKIPFGDKSFDVCYGRHILEHLDTYEIALSEMARIAKKEILIIFFREPKDKMDAYVLKRDFKIKLFQKQMNMKDKKQIKEITDRIGKIRGDFYFQNRWDKTKLELFIRKLPNIKDFKWGRKISNEIFLHIYMED